MYENKIINGILLSHYTSTGSLLLLSKDPVQVHTCWAGNCDTQQAEN